MTSDDFEQLVDEGIKAIPKRFLDLLDNVAIVIEDFPTAEQTRKLRLKHPWALFGLYEGVPKTKRGPSYFGVLPDKITIFRQPIEQASFDPATVKEIVKNTVWHEIAHHFGLDHEQIRRAQQKKLPN
jgi:predicted Zn-dependent protease with MMP-like domain